MSAILIFLFDSDDKDVLFHCFLMNVEGFEAFVCSIEIDFSVKIVRHKVEWDDDNIISREISFFYCFDVNWPSLMLTNHFFSLVSVVSFVSDNVKCLFSDTMSEHWVSFIFSFSDSI